MPSNSSSNLVGTIPQRLVLALALAMSLTAASAGAAAPSVVPIELTVPVPPTAVRSNGAWHLLYELRLSNFSTREISLEQLEVVGEDGQRLANYVGPALARTLARPAQGTSASGTTLAPGTFGTLFVEVEVPATGAPPRRISYRLRVAGAAGADASRTTIEGPYVTVAPARDAVVLGPPLKGGNWLAANGLSNDSDHRRTLVVVDGRARIAQRYAVDLVRLDAGGRPFNGDMSKNSSWAGYRAPVLAVADGRVESVRTDLPDNTPGQLPATKISLDTIGGNTVALDIGHGRHVLYGHLVPGSVTVVPGQKVRKGQMIGELGNSGQSDAPHLHIQVADAASPLAAEGLPYVFDCYRSLGKVSSLDAVLEGRGSWQPGVERGTRSNELPQADEVVGFCR